MAWSAIRTALLAASLSVLLAGGARADDSLKIAIGQRGGWEQSVSELGQNKGFFKKHGLALAVHAGQRRDAAVGDLQQRR